jgi:AcrR family transcriptional regulator
MSSSVDDGISTRRSHDAEASRAALLEAGRQLFDELGFDRATVRQIGDRAGVDPALIARYFDSKEGLFLAACATPAPDEAELPADPRAFVAWLLERWDDYGHSPLSRALASPALTAEVRDKIGAVVRDRLLGPLVEELGRRGAPDAELRAELLVALALGVSITRANATLAANAAAPRDQVLATLGPAIDALAGPGPA